MEIVDVEILHADAGWTYYSFIKLMTDEGVIGLNTTRVLPPLD